MDSSTIDWTAFGYRRSLNFDDLRRFSAADLDPYTVQVGEALCESLIFSQRGHRNLVTTFDSLPGKYYSAEDFEVGYGAFHIVRVILKTDTGFSLAALVGLLSEYFKEDVVVDFFVELAKRAQVPDAHTPLRHQWRRMVDVLYGILSTSSFSTSLTSLEDTLPLILGDLDARKLLHAVLEMSTVAAKKQTSISLPVGADLVWLAAIATWLFDLTFVVQSTSGNVIYSSTGTFGQTAQVTFNLEDSVNLTGSLTPASTTSSTNTSITGGRVSFEQFFRTCFGDAASILKDNALAMYICCASNLLRDALATKNLTSRSPFLAQAGATHGKASYGLTESMIGWFPELRQQAPRFKRYESLESEASHEGFNEASARLREQCQCLACTGRTDTGTTSRFCKLTLAEVIFNLGFYIRLMVITPKLYPKRNGVRTFYDQFHSTRLSASSSPTPPSVPTSSAVFVDQIVTRLSSSLNMLQMSALLFADTDPTELETGATDLMGITTTGLTVFLTGFKQFHAENQEDEDQRVLNVIVSPGWMCLFGHEARFEVYEPAYLHLSFEQVWENARVNPGVLRQMMRWEGRVMTTSFVRRKPEDEERARADGWILL